MTSKTAEITQSKCSVKNQQYVQWCKNVDSKTVIKTNSKTLSENLSELTLIQKFVYAFKCSRHTKIAMSRTQWDLTRQNSKNVHAMMNESAYT
mgnify:CR=1 FL=1